MPPVATYIYVRPFSKCYAGKGSGDMA